MVVEGKSKAQSGVQKFMGIQTVYMELPLPKQDKI